MREPVVVCVAVSTQPTRNIGAHDVLSHRPSMDASLSGCLLVTSMAMLGPKMNRLREGEDDEERQGQLEVGLGQVDVALLEQVPGADAEHQRRARRSTTPPTRAAAAG